MSVYVERPGPGRVVGRVLIGLIIAAVVFILLDVGARLWAESYVSDELQSSLQLTAKPSVSFGGIAFIPSLLGGDIDAASVEAGSVQAGPVRFGRVKLTLRNIDFSLGRLLLQRSETITAHAGDGSANVTDLQLTRAFQSQGVRVRVRFTSKDRVRVAGLGLPGPMTVVPSIAQGALVLAPANPDASGNTAFRIRLPQLVDGLTYRSLSIRDGVGVLLFDIRDARFPVGSG